MLKRVLIIGGLGFIGMNVASLRYYIIGFRFLCRSLFYSRKQSAAVRLYSGHQVGVARRRIGTYGDQ